ncbi:MAG: hypothetical protein QOI10_1634 [Solirubrobacterales bacterium]|jgi:uncharacterized protein (TIGR02118 family)|nr:hypothetical protein [Solirubrobacterales bacterium]
MIKLTFVIRRKPGVEAAEFHRYWRDEHAQLVATHAQTLRVRRYVQSHRIETPIDAALAGSREITGEPYDGIAELWWDSIEDLVAVMSEEAGVAASTALLEDEARFIDVPASAIWLNEEHEILVEPAA